MPRIYYSLQTVTQCPICQNDDLRMIDVYRNSMMGNNYPIRTRTRVLFCDKCRQQIKEVTDLKE